MGEGGIESLHRTQESFLIHSVKIFNGHHLFEINLLFIVFFV